LSTAQVSNCQLKDFNFNANDKASGAVLLCETSRGLFGRASVMGLIPGDAYTAWWAYFDDASACATPNSCGGPETAGDNPVAVFGRMDSFIVPRHGHVHVHVHVHFNGKMRHFKPSDGSQVTILMINHGPADMDNKQRLARQLLTPEVPRFGAPHLGNIVDGTLGAVIGGAPFLIP